jgi:prevent-host-death family protein
MSTTVGVRDLKNSLSRWLRLVRSGEVVVILDRGRPVAVLSPAVTDGKARTAVEHLASLARRGLMVLGTARRRPRPKSLPKANLSDAVGEDRGEIT